MNRETIDIDKTLANVKECDAECQRLHNEIQDLLKEEKENQKKHDEEFDRFMKFLREPGPVIID